MKKQTGKSRVCERARALSFEVHDGCLIVLQRQNNPSNMPMVELHLGAGGRWLLTDSRDPSPFKDLASHPLRQVWKSLNADQALAILEEAAKVPFAERRLQSIWLEAQETRSY